MSSNALEDFNLQTSNYGFSGVGLDDLGASEYTLVTIAVDESGSVQDFKDEMEQALASVVEACRKSPRANNLMLRLVGFGTTFREINGFKELQNCNPDDYKGIINISGMTALHDACVNAIEAADVYGTQLVQNDFECNGLLVVITDGCNNHSTNTETQVKEALEKIKLTEHIDGGLLSILIGVNINNQEVKKELSAFERNVGFMQYVELSDANPSTLAKVANFVSRSVSSQSQSLATNGPSKAVQF